MTENEVRLKRTLLDATGNRTAVYVPPGKRRQLLLEREEAEKRKLEEPEIKKDVKIEEEHDSTEAEDQSSSTDPKNGDITTEDSELKKQQQAMSIQRETWQDQRRVINGTINRLNSATIKPLIQELFQKANLVRLRGPLCKSVLLAAVSSPKYSDVYAAITSVINSKLPEVGELMVNRAILAFRRYYKQRDKSSCQAVCVYIVHLFHQGVVHELIVLQLLSVLLDGSRPTDDSVEVAVHILQTAGQALLECSTAGVRACTERMRSLLHEGHLNQRVEYHVEELLKARKNGFKDFPSVSEELDLVERDDQITFDTSLDDEDIRKEDELDVFSFDPEYEEKEAEWKAIRDEVLGLGDSSTDDSDDSDSDDDSDSSDDESKDEASASGENAPAAVSADSDKQVAVVEDLTEADLIHLRRTIYLTIMSSATFEECAHKLARINVPTGRESELINMLIECCSQERTFLRYYGLIASRFCLMDNRWKDAFMESFVEQYNTIHRLETNKLRNVAKLFSHLLHTDSVPWSIMNVIHLNEDETTSSSRIFIKIVIQEMAEAMGITKLRERFYTQDQEHKLWYAGMFPKDNVRNTRYAINFFTSIGLGPLTDDLREFLKNAPKLILAKAKEAALAKQNEDLSDESSVVSSTSSSSFSSSSSSVSTSSSSSYTSSDSSSYSSSSSLSSLPSRYRRKGRSSGRERSIRGRRRRDYSSDDSSSSGSSRSSDDDSRRPRGRRRTESRRRRGRSRSPPKVITRGDKSPGDRDISAGRRGSSRSPSSSLSINRRTDGRKRNRDRSLSPPKVISSKQYRDDQKSSSRSQQREQSSNRSPSGRRGNQRGKLPRSRSPRQSPRRSAPRGRDSSRSPKRGSQDRSSSPGRSPGQSSNGVLSGDRSRDSRRSSSPTHRRRASSISPPRGRSRERKRSSRRSPGRRSSSNSPPRGTKRGRNDSPRHGRLKSPSSKTDSSENKESPGKKQREDGKSPSRSRSVSRSKSPPKGNSRSKGGRSRSRSQSPLRGISRRKGSRSRSRSQSPARSNRQRSQSRSQTTSRGRNDRRRGSRSLSSSQSRSSGSGGRRKNISSKKRNRRRSSSSSRSSSSFSSRDSGSSSSFSSRRERGRKRRGNGRRDRSRQERRRSPSSSQSRSRSRSPSRNTDRKERSRTRSPPSNNIVKEEQQDRGYHNKERSPQR